MDSAKAADLHSAGDFTVLVKGYCPDQTSQCGFFARWPGAPNNEWCLLQMSTRRLRFYASADGTASVYKEHSGAYFNNGEDFFVAGRYDHSATDIFVTMDDHGSQSLNFAGPTYAATADLVFGDYGSGSWKGYIYCAAYFDKLLTDDELTDIQTGRVEPWEFGPVYYFGGGKQGASYDAEVADGAQAPYTHAVEGGAVRGGPVGSGPDIPEALASTGLWYLPHGLASCSRTRAGWSRRGLLARCRHRRNRRRRPCADRRCRWKRL